MSSQEITIEAETVEQARQAVQARIPSGERLLSENIVADGNPKTVRASASTVDIAVQKLQADLPAGAVVLTTRTLMMPESKTVSVEAEDDQGARVAALNAVIAWSVRPTVNSVDVVERGKAGFLGIGKQPAKYEVRLFREAVVELRYNSPAIVTFRVGTEPKTVVTVLREFLLAHENELQQLGGTKNLEFIDLLRNIVNSRFSDEHVKRALSAPNTKMRTLVRQFLEQVKREAGQ